MNEDFVTYEQAVKLKELGFDWDTIAFYLETVLITKIINWHTTNATDLPIFSAPTLAQAQKWLREKGIEVMSYYDYTTKTWIFEVCEIGDPHFYGYHSDDFGLNKPTYEQALSAGIDQALKFLKEK